MKINNLLLTVLITFLSVQIIYSQEKQTDAIDQLELEKAFFHAARTSDMEILIEFVNSGADINYPGENGYTALMIAAYNGQQKPVEFLLEKGADLCLKDSRGNTALMGAIVAGEDEIAVLLLEREQCPSLINERTIDFANRFGRAEILKLLKEKYQTNEE